MNRRNINRKLRKKSLETQRVASLNILHDLKHHNTIDNLTVINMLQREVVKPKKISKYGSIIRRKWVAPSCVKIIK